MKKVIILIYLGMILYGSSCYTKKEKVTEKTIEGQTDKLTSDINVIGCDGSTYKIISGLKTIKSLPDATIASSGVRVNADH